MTLDEVVKHARPEPTQIHRVIIATTPDQIWQAITDPEWTVRYGFGGRSVVEPRVGGAFTVYAPTGLQVVDDTRPIPEPEIIIQGTVIDYEPPWLLGVRIRFLGNEHLAAEPETYLRHEVRDRGDGTCALTIVHEVAGAPLVSIIGSGDLEEQGFGGGYPFMLSDLKSLLETGRALPVSRPQRKAETPRV